jgi:hypothetical protein
VGQNVAVCHFISGTLETTKRSKFLQCLIAHQRYAIHPLTDEFLNRLTNSGVLYIQRVTSQQGTDYCKRPFFNIKQKEAYLDFYLWRGAAVKINTLSSGIS